MKSQQRHKAQRIQSIEGKKLLRLVEDSFQLQFPIQFELRGRQAGALVLGRGKNLDSLRFVFGFDCKGIHSNLKPEQQDVVFDALENGLKDLPQKELLTVHFGSFRSDQDRQSYLDGLIETAPTDRLKFLLYGQKKRVQQLKQQGMRKPKFLRLYVTYTIEPEAVGANQPIEKALKKFHGIWSQFTGMAEDVESQRLDEVFTRAFTDGYQRWHQLIANKLNLDIQPMQVEDLWDVTWKRFNPSKPTPQIPQLIKFTDSGIEEEIYSEVHATSALVGSQESCPVADKAWIHLDGKVKRDRIVGGTYIGVLPWTEKPAGWASKNDEMRYLWELLSRDLVYDTEVFCEISRANEAILKTNMQRLVKQSIVAADNANTKQSVDVAATLKVKKAVAAQEQLFEGSVPLHTATVLCIHRKDLDELDEACRYLQSCIRRPAEIDREIEYAWKIWLQTLPIVWEPLLTTPFNRRITYLTEEAPAFMSLVRPRTNDRSGFELLSEEGGVPMHLDLFKQHRNLAVFGTTRSGKSVMISDILTQALSHKIPIVVLDFPTDTASTFRDYVSFLGKKTGAYFDIGKECNNLFEIPDLRSFPLSVQRERMKDYIAFLETALMTMILGATTSGDNADLLMLRKTIRSLISLLLSQFFDDESIMKRYWAALDAGLGTPEWVNIPTLRDFLNFCSLDRIGEENTSGDTPRAMDWIRLQLKFWITSRVGKAISQPSSFRSDVPLLVFALRNLNEDDDAAILSLSAYAVAYRNTLKAPESIFFIDESPILFTFSAIAELVARLCANGAKAGVRVIISAQDPDTIAKSESASKVLQNLNTRLIGRIQPVAVPSFVRIFGYPIELIGRNATESFFPKREGIYSQWLLDDNGTMTYCRYYSSFLQLAAVVNNPHEQRARDAYIIAYPNWYEALTHFSEALIAAMQSGRDIKLPDPGLTVVVPAKPKQTVPVK